MEIGGSVLNLSSLLYTEGLDLIQKERAVFLVGDFRYDLVPADDMTYFIVYFGEDIVEDSMSGRSFLALLRKDGTYILERAEKYLEERERNGVRTLALDLQKLPDEIDGVKLHKNHFERMAHWHSGVLHSEDGTVWNLEGWNTVIFIIGANYTGKSHFIEQKFKQSKCEILDVYSYQLRADKELRGSPEREKLYWANAKLCSDIVDLLRRGKDVVVEHTLCRALRRLGYVEAVREISRNIPVIVYVMSPSDEQLLHNIEKRTEGNHKYVFERTKRELSEIFEFPNPAEDFTRIYEVSDNGITERMDEWDWERIKRAREELAEEAEKRRKKREEQKRREKLIQDMEHIRFWHYCEVCGKKELLTADEAFEQGWDYPPRMGRFGSPLTARTCGNCIITDSLCFKLLTGQKTFFDLTDDEKKILNRIRNEPESLLPSEDET